MSEIFPIHQYRMGGASVYLMDVSNVDENTFAAELPSALLTYAYSTFKSQKRQKEWLGTRLLLKLVEGNNAEISYTDTGAPILRNSSRHISVSHSGTFVAIALSDQHVGLDIQVITNKALRLKSRFLSEEEQLMLDSESDIEGAVQLWCAKEAVYKYLSIPGTELIGGIVLQKHEDGVGESLHNLRIRFNKYENVVMAIAEK